MIHVVPKDAKRANMPTRDETEKLTTAQLWAKLRTRHATSDVVYWAKVELRKRGYCV
jgi:hypothetical protein